LAGQWRLELACGERFQVAEAAAEIKGQRLNTEITERSALRSQRKQSRVRVLI